MSYAITWSEQAVDAASRYLTDSPGLTQVMNAVDRLAAEPRPGASFPYGGEDLRRLRVGPYRVLYEINPVDLAITILHLGRVA